MRHAPIRWAGLLIASGALLLGACTNNEAATPSPTPIATATLTATGTATAGIETVREADLSDIALIGPIIDHFGGGEIEPARTTYADLTDDGVEEAVIFVESGGTQGDLGIAVLHVQDGAATVLDYVEGSGRVELVLPEAGGGTIVSREGIWAPGDAECCPSQLRERFYEWDGTSFVVAVDQVIDNPDR